MPVAALSGCSGPNDSPEQDGGMETFGKLTEFLMLPFSK